MNNMNKQKLEARERREKLKAENRCVLCAKPIEADRIGRTICGKCSDKSKDFKSKRKSKGLCTRCGQPKEADRMDKTTCLNCLRIATDSNKASRIKRGILGVGHWIDIEDGYYPNEEVCEVIVCDENGEVYGYNKMSGESWEDAMFDAGVEAWRYFPKPFKRKATQ